MLVWSGRSRPLPAPSPESSAPTEEQLKLGVNWVAGPGCDSKGLLSTINSHLAAAFASVAGSKLTAMGKLKQLGTCDPGNFRRFRFLRHSRISKLDRQVGTAR